MYVAPTVTFVHPTDAPGEEGTPIGDLGPILRSRTAVWRPLR